MSARGSPHQRAGQHGAGTSGTSSFTDDHDAGLCDVMNAEKREFSNSTVLLFPNICSIVNVILIYTTVQRMLGFILDTLCVPGAQKQSFCSNSQQCIVWVKIINVSVMQKIIRICSMEIVNVLL